MEQASELFMDLLCDCGAPSVDCGLCGRTHFATGEYSCEDEQEIERFRKLAEASPDKYYESSDDAIGWGIIDDKQVVWDCPCKKLRRYEDFIWRHRKFIIDYIKARTDKELGEANEMREKLSAV